MLCVELVKDTLDIFHSKKIDKSVVVCPNSLVADLVRKNLKEISLYKHEALTISNFIKKELLSEELEVKRKSEILLELSIVWKKNFPKLEYSQFSRAFKIFTELRGFTLDANLIDEIYNEFDEDISNLLKLFWKEFEDQNIVDEQASYQLLSKKYDKDLDDQRDVIFYGFPFLNAIQIDLLKKLAEKRNVYVPYDEELFHETIMSDWIRWLRPEANKNFKKNENKKTVDVVHYSKKKMSIKLKKYIKENSIEKIILMDRNPTYEHFNEIPANDFYFRYSVSPFESIVDVYFDYIKEKILKDEVIAVDDVLIFLKENYEKEKKDFRKIKILLEMIELLENWKELLEENNEIKYSDFELLREVFLLNLPRNYSSPLIKKGDKKIMGLEGLFGKGEHSLICVSSQYHASSGMTEKFPSEVKLFLQTIGPVKRSLIEWKETFLNFKNYIENNKVVLFLEENIEESLFIWRDLRSFNFKEIVLDEESAIIRKDFLSDFIEKKNTVLKQILQQGCSHILIVLENIILDIYKKLAQLRDIQILLKQVI